MSKIIGIGTDMVNIARIGDMLQRYGERFIQRVLSPQEQAILAKSSQPHAYIAKRFAGKEAVAKAFGTGIGQHLAFNEISITNLPSGQPQVSFIGKAQAYISTHPDIQIFISLSDEKEHALAFVVLSTA